MKHINNYFFEKLQLNSQSKLTNKVSIHTKHNKKYTIDTIHKLLIDHDHFKKLPENEKPNYIRIYLHDTTNYAFNSYNSFIIKIDDLVDIISVNSYNKDDLLDLFFKIAKKYYDNDINEIIVQYWDTSRVNGTMIEFGRLNKKNRKVIVRKYIDLDKITNIDIKNKLSAVLQ